MKTVFTNSAELFSYLEAIYDPGLDVDIATFNMYLGISKGTDWSLRFPSPARSFIDQARAGNLRIVLGQPPLVECHPGCEHCRERYKNARQRDFDTATRLGLNIRVHGKLHLKYYRVGDLVIVGGINLGASDAVDASLIVTDWNQRATLMDLFESAWANSAPIDLVQEVVS